MIDAATTLGVHRATVHEWLRRPAFRGLLEDLRRDALRTVADRMRSNLTKATDVVAAILDNATASDRDRLAAAALAYKAAGDTLPGLAVKREERARSLDELALNTARRAYAMSGGMFFPIEDQRTPGTAWAKAEIERVFPGSYVRLRAHGEDLEGAAAYCDELLGKWRDMLDEDALAGDGEDEGAA